MSVRQFAISLQIIQRNEHSNRAGALLRHLWWQGRKLFFPRPVRLQISKSIIMDDEPGGVISSVNMLGRYDYNNMHFVQAVLAKAPVFIDVGANIGAYTLIASEVPSAAVVSLEPIPAAFAKLERNIALNKRSGVRALNVAASKQPGELRMTSNGASVVNQVVADDAAGDGTALVAVDTLDAICARFGLSPSLIKIDVEGHEPEVLAGAVECMRSCEACIVENGDRASIVSFMREHGMAGPFYYQHRSGTLEHAPQSLAEDQIFVSRRFASLFPGIAIEAGHEGARRG